MMGLANNPIILFGRLIQLMRSPQENYEANDC